MRYILQPLFLVGSTNANKRSKMLEDCFHVFVRPGNTLRCRCWRLVHYPVTAYALAQEADRNNIFAVIMLIRVGNRYPSQHPSGPAREYKIFGGRSAHISH